MDESVWVNIPEALNLAGFTQYLMAYWQSQLMSLFMIYLGSLPCFCGVSFFDIDGNRESNSDMTSSAFASAWLSLSDPAPPKRSHIRLAINLKSTSGFYTMINFLFGIIPWRRHLSPRDRALIPAGKQFLNPSR